MSRLPKASSWMNHTENRCDWFFSLCRLWNGSIFQLHSISRILIYVSSPLIRGDEDAIASMRDVSDFHRSRHGIARASTLSGLRGSYILAELNIYVSSACRSEMPLQSPTQSTLRYFQISVFARSSQCVFLEWGCRGLNCIQRAGCTFAPSCLRINRVLSQPGP